MSGKETVGNKNKDKIEKEKGKLLAYFPPLRASIALTNGLFVG